MPRTIGVKTKATLDEFRRLAIDAGITPLEFLFTGFATGKIKGLRKHLDVNQRLQCAKELLPYGYAKIQPTPGDLDPDQQLLEVSWDTGDLFDEDSNTLPASPGPVTLTQED